jgi:hypothetical protein
MLVSNCEKNHSLSFRIKRNGMRNPKYHTGISPLFYLKSQIDIEIKAKPEGMVTA